MLVAPIVVQFAALTGFMAAAIAVGGFVTHARSAIAGESEERLRRLTAGGGILGLLIALGVTVGGMVL